jgi:hypothetical protein
VGTKTVTLKNEAYDRLRAARRYPSESFSEVLLRATWPEDTTTGGALLERLRRGALFSSDELDRVDRMKQQDSAPVDKWADR